MKTSPGLKNLVVTLLALCVVLVLAEGILQVADYPRALKVGWRWDQSPYRNQNDPRVNQLGLRGSPIEYSENDFVVVLLGDSQVEAGTQPAEKLPETLLRQALQDKSGHNNVKVFSIASAGWGNDQQLVWLKKYFENHRADLVVNWLTPVNDYWENTFIDRSVAIEAGRLKPTYRIDTFNTLESVLPVSLDWKLMNLVVLAAGRALRGDKYTLEEYYANAWQKKLPSTSAMQSAKADCPSNEIAQKTLIESYVRGSRSYTLLTDEDVPHGRSHFSPFLKHSSPRDDYAIQVTHRLIEELASTARKHGAQFFMYHTYRHDLDGAFREIKCVRTPDGRHFPFDGSDWLRFLKASPLAPQLLTSNISSTHALTVGPNDWHFNEEGNRKAMSELATRILGKMTMDRSGASTR